MEWNVNVESAVRAGVAKSVGTPEKGLGLATFNPTGFMIVRPSYESSNAPDFIQVSVGFRGTGAMKMSLETLQETVEKARSELYPYYKVVGRAENLKQGTAVYYFISK